MQENNVCQRCNGIIFLSAKKAVRSYKINRKPGPRPPPPPEYDLDPHRYYNSWYKYGWDLEKLREWLVERLEMRVPVQHQTRSFMAEVDPDDIEGLHDANKLEAVEINADLGNVKKMVLHSLRSIRNTQFKETVPAEFDREDFEKNLEEVDDMDEYMKNLGDSRVMFEVEAFVPMIKGKNKNHFKIGVYFDAQPGNTDWWFGQYVLYMADLS